MTWGYPPKPKPKKYGLFGYSSYTPPRPKPPRLPLRTTGKGFPTSRTAPGGQNAGGKTTTTPGETFDPYPAYTDLFSGLLAELSAARLRDIGVMRGDLTGREGAIKQLYADQAPQIDANFNQAVKSSAAVNDAVANRLSAEGQVTNADLLAKLQQIGAPQGATDQAANQVKSYYSGLGGANYAGDAGDVQRLIGAQSEAQNYNTKQPGIITADLEQQYQADLADLQAAYEQNAMGLNQQSAEAQAGYKQSKWEYETGQKQAIADRKAAKAQADEDTYWQNYWKKQEILQRRWEVNMARGDKKAANQAKKDIAALNNKADIDIANIRAGATVTAATTRAATATAKANAPKPPKIISGPTVQKAKTDALNAVFNTKSGHVREKVNSDNGVQAIVNNILNQYGIGPYSAQGTSIRKWVFSKIHNRTYQNGDVFKAGKDRLPK